MAKSDSSHDKAMQNMETEIPQEDLANAELEEDDFLATGPDIPVPEDAFRRWKEEMQQEIAAKEAAAEQALAAQEAQQLPQDSQNAMWQADQFRQMPQESAFPAPGAAQQPFFPQQFGAEQGFMPPLPNQPVPQGYQPFGNQMPQMAPEQPIDQGPFWQNDPAQVQQSAFGAQAAQAQQPQEQVESVIDEENVPDQDVIQEQVEVEQEDQAPEIEESVQAQAVTSPQAPISPAITSPQPPATPVIPEHLRTGGSAVTQKTDEEQEEAVEAEDERAQESQESFISQGASASQEEAQETTVTSYVTAEEGASAQQDTESIVSESFEASQVTPPVAMPQSGQAFAVQSEGSEQQVIGSHVKTPAEQAAQDGISAEPQRTDSFDLPITTSQFKRVTFESEEQPAQDAIAETPYDPALGQASPYGEYDYQNFGTDYQQHPQDEAWSQYQNWQYQSQMPSISSQDQMAGYQQTVPQEEPYAGFQQDQMISQYAAASAIEPMQQIYPDYNVVNQFGQPQQGQNFDYQNQYGQMPQGYADYQQGYVPNQNMQQGYYQQYPYQDYGQQAYPGQDYSQTAYQQMYDQAGYNQQGYAQQPYQQGFDQAQAYPQMGYDQQQQYFQQGYDPQAAYQAQYSQMPYDQQQYYNQQDLNQAAYQQGYPQDAQQFGYPQQEAVQEQYQQQIQGQPDMSMPETPQEGVPGDLQTAQQFVETVQSQPQEYAASELQQQAMSEAAAEQAAVADVNAAPQDFDVQVQVQSEFAALDASSTQVMDALQQPPFPQEFAETTSIQQAAKDQITSDYAAAVAAGMVQPGVGATGSFADYATNKKPKRRKKSKGAAAQAQAQQAQALKAAGAHGSGRKKKMSTFKKVLLILGGGIICVAAIAAIGVGMYLGSISSNLQEGIDEEVKGVLAEPKSAEEPFYTLILGSDTREEGAGGRSDTIILARIAPETKQVSLVSIPRDTQVQIEGHGTQKINAAYAFGGTSGAITAVSKLADVPISHVVEVDFSGFKEIVDALGGVTVNVPDNTYYDGISIPPGKQTLNGDQALVFVRCRKSYASGDYQRAENQRQLIGAIVKKTLSSSVIEMTGIIDSITKAVATDMSVTDILALANELRGMDTKDMITCVMPSHTGSQDGISYVFVEEPEWSEMMAIINEGGDPNDTKKKKKSSSSSSSSKNKSSSSDSDLGLY